MQYIKKLYNNKEVKLDNFTARSSALGSKTVCLQVIVDVALSEIIKCSQVMFLLIVQVG